MVANNRFNSDSGTEDDDAEILRLVRKLQKIFLRRATVCADQDIMGEALSLSEGARNAGEIICQINDYAEIDDTGDIDDEDEG